VLACLTPRRVARVLPVAPLLLVGGIEVDPAKPNDPAVERRVTLHDVSHARHRKALAFRCQTVYGFPMSKTNTTKKNASANANGAPPQDDPKLRDRVGAIIQLAGGTAFAKELFGVSREAMKQFLGGPACGRSHSGTLLSIRMNVDTAEKRAAAIAKERAASEKETTKKRAPRPRAQKAAAAT
jgi:hypothetical protein